MSASVVMLAVWRGPQKKVNQAKLKLATAPAALACLRCVHGRLPMYTTCRAAHAHTLLLAHFNSAPATLPSLRYTAPMPLHACMLTSGAHLMHLQEPNTHTHCIINPILILDATLQLVNALHASPNLALIALTGFLQAPKGLCLWQ